MNFFTELKNRWNQDSPIFHQKLQQFGNWLLVTSIALSGIPTAMEQANLAQFDLTLLVRISSYMFLASVVIKAVAGTAVKNPDYSKLDQPQPKQDPNKLE